MFAGALMLGGYVYLITGWILAMKQPRATPAFANDWQEAVFVGMAAFWLLRFAGNLRAKPTRYQLLGDGALALLWVFDALFPFAMRLSKGMDFFQAFAVLAVAELAFVAFVFLMYREKQQPAA
ncbi:MAG TPA: hypothetical protein VFL13_16275 [Candidatus Baltobacteraceae bacterium]|nr:hypothetical protein [Candidatus Baltobacteraceae bacterium]